MSTGISLVLRRIWRLRLQVLSKVDEIAPFKTDGFEKRKEIRRIPPYGGVDFLHALFLVIVEDALGQALSDLLTHVLGVHAEHGYPRDFLGAENPGRDDADHEAYHFAPDFCDQAGVGVSLCRFCDDGLEINTGGCLRDGRINSAHLIGIVFSHFPDQDLGHRSNPFLLWENARQSILMILT